MRTKEYEFTEFTELVGIAVAAILLCVTIVVSRAMM